MDEQELPSRRRSPWRAAIANLFSPPLGHIHAGQARRSLLLFLAASALGVGLLFLASQLVGLRAYWMPSSAMAPTLQMGDRFLVNKSLYWARPPQQGDVVLFRAPPVASPEEKEFVKRVVGLPGQTVEVKPDTVTVDGKAAVHMLDPDAADPYGSFRHEIPRGLVVAKDREPDLSHIEHGVITLPTPDNSVPVIASRTGAVTYVGKSVRVDGVERAKMPGGGLLREEHNLSRLGADPGVRGTAVFSGEAPLLIVLQGARLGFQPGHVTLDDKPIKEPYVAQAPRYAMAPYRVPTGDLFVLGDNRNDSNDSHAWGPLELRRVTGKAITIYWPPGRNGPIH